MLLLARVFVIGLLFVLAGCDGGGGGGGSGGGTPGGSGNFTIGGTISGLSGTVLLGNGSVPMQSFSANGPFTFTTPAPSGTTYNITVLQQPTGQTCTVTGGAGTVASSNVTSVTVSCTNTGSGGTGKTVGGTVSGLSGVLILRSNGGDALTLSTNGAFTFPTQLALGATYSVSVDSSPLGQTCTVSNGSGTIAGNVSNIAVTCSDIGGGGATLSIMFEVSGLSGAIVVSNNGGNNVNVTADGTYFFPFLVSSGASYNVTTTQPAGQTCTVSNGSGTATNHVFNILIDCRATTTPTYTIGYTVSGLSGSVVLSNSGTDLMSVSSNGSRVFSTRLTQGSAYNVAVVTQPAGQTCVVANGSGTVTANVSNITVTCSNTTTPTYTLGFSVTGLSGSLVLKNNSNGETVSVTANGNYTFNSRINQGSNYAVVVSTQPSGQTCTVSNGTGTATANVTNVAVACSSASYTLGFTVTGLSGSLVLKNNGNSETVSVTANGSYTFNNRISQGGSYAVVVSTQPANQTCSVSNGTGTATANVTTVAVSCLMPSTINISAQPQDQVAEVGSNVLFSVTATDGGFTSGLTYQWQRNNVDIAGATGSTYAAPNVQLSNDRDTFRVKVTSESGFSPKYSNYATLRVGNPLSFQYGLSERRITAGTLICFAAKASSAESITYQWRRDGTGIPGATSRFYSSSPTLATTADTGSRWQVIAANSLVSKTSEATLRVDERIEIFHFSGHDYLATDSLGENRDGCPATYGSIKQIALDSSKNLVVADGNRVRKVTRTGFTTTIPSELCLPGICEPYFSNITAIAVDQSDNIYVADSSGKIKKITSSGDIYDYVDLRAAVYDTTIEAHDMTIDRSGIIYAVIDRSSSNIVKISRRSDGTGAAGVHATVPGAKTIAYDPAWDPTIGGTANAEREMLLVGTDHVIYRVSPIESICCNGREITVFAGSDTSTDTDLDGTGGQARFSNIYDMAFWVDGLGASHLVVASGKTVRGVDVNGSVSTLIGGLGTSGRYGDYPHVITSASIRSLAPPVPYAGMRSPPWVYIADSRQIFKLDCSSRNC